MKDAPGRAVEVNNALSVIKHNIKNDELGAGQPLLIGNMKTSCILYRTGSGPRRGATGARGAGAASSVPLTPQLGFLLFCL